MNFHQCFGICLLQDINKLLPPKPTSITKIEFVHGINFSVVDEHAFNVRLFCIGNININTDIIILKVTGMPLCLLFENSF